MNESCPECGRSEGKEITLAVFIATLRIRKKILVTVFMAVVLGSVMVTSAQAPVYESTAVIVATNEREELLVLINSPAFEDAVRDFSGNELEISGAMGPLDLPMEQRTEIALVFQGGGQAIKAASEQALLVLEDMQGELREVTWSKNWPAYYEAAGRDAGLAERELQALVDGMTYYDVISGPTGAHKVSPNLNLNLSLGVVMGLLFGISSALGWARLQAYRASSS